KKPVVIMLDRLEPAPDLADSFERSGCLVVQVEHSLAAKLAVQALTRVDRERTILLVNNLCTEDVSDTFPELERSAEGYLVLPVTESDLPPRSTPSRATLAHKRSASRWVATLSQPGNTIRNSSPPYRPTPS